MPSSDQSTGTPFVPPNGDLGTHSFHDTKDDPAPATESGTVADAAPIPQQKPLGMFGKYELLEEFPGGMGIVYMARDTELGRVVALKKLFPAHRPRPGEIERFVREAFAVAQLSHPHIIPIHECNQIDGERYFTTDFIHGGNLAEHRPRFQCDPRASVALMEKVARAVHHAHTHGIVHRDLKPANILLTGADEPLVSDFGLAKLLDSDAELTTTGTILGTPAYMSPEQARGATGSLDVRTDIWSLGVILYELLAGTRPFPGSTRNEVTPRILNDEPVPPRIRQPALDTRLDTVVMKCLQKLTADRYPSAEALADDLKRWLENQPIEARLPKPPRKVSRRKFLWAGLGVTAAATAGFGVSRFFGEETSAMRAARKAIELTLRNHGTATLIGEDGEPKWRKWQHGHGTQIEMSDHTFSVETDTLALLELLPDPKVNSFRLKAKVRQNSSEQGAVGLYFGRVVVDSLPNAQWFCTFQFADRGRQIALDKDATGNPRGPAAVVFHRVGPNRGETTLNTTIRFPFEPAGKAESPWRTLTLDVEVDSVTAWWGVKESDKKVDAKNEFNQWARNLDGIHSVDLDDRYPSFTALAGLGLFVDQSSASFRDVEIGPPGR